MVRLVAADCFPSEDPEVVMWYLDQYGVEPYEMERERVQLGVLRLAQGDPDKLLYFIGLAKTDYRDILAWAENYPIA